MVVKESDEVLAAVCSERPPLGRFRRGSIAAAPTDDMLHLIHKLVSLNSCTTEHLDNTSILISQS